MLNLDRNYLTDAHLSLLENMRCRNLKYLSLRYNLITDEGALILAKNAFWKKLEVLDLWGNEIKKYKSAILLMKRTLGKLGSPLSAIPQMGEREDTGDFKLPATRVIALTSHLQYLKFANRVPTKAHYKQ